MIYVHTLQSKTSDIIHFWCIKVNIAEFSSPGSPIKHFKLLINLRRQKTNQHIQNIKSKTIRDDIKETLEDNKLSTMNRFNRKCPQPHMNRKWC